MKRKVTNEIKQLEKKKAKIASDSYLKAEKLNLKSPNLQNICKI